LDRIGRRAAVCLFRCPPAPASHPRGRAAVERSPRAGRVLKEGSDGDRGRVAFPTNHTFLAELDWIGAVWEVTGSLLRSCLALQANPACASMSPWGASVNQRTARRGKLYKDLDRWIAFQERARTVGLRPYRGPEPRAGQPSSLRCRRVVPGLDQARRAEGSRRRETSSGSSPRRHNRRVADTGVRSKDPQRHAA
jgi:hypothetical protein